MFWTKEERAILPLPPCPKSKKNPKTSAGVCEVVFSEQMTQWQLGELLRFQGLKCRLYFARKVPPSHPQTLLYLHLKHRPWANEWHHSTFVCLRNKADGEAVLWWMGLMQVIMMQERGATFILPAGGPRGLLKAKDAEWSRGHANKCIQVIAGERKVHHGSSNNIKMIN